MHNILLLLAAALVVACDAETTNHCAMPSTLELAPPEGVTLPAIAFREQGPPNASYISTWNGQPIHAAEFAEAVLACSKVGDPPWLLTLSDYDPDVAVTDNRVVGLGGSIVASDELYQCLVKDWAGNDPMEIP